MAEINGEDPLDPEEARTLLGRREAVAIDLRDNAPDGHAPGAVIVGEDEPEQAAERAQHEGESKPVLVFCEDGNESDEVAAKLRDAGYEAVAIKGGWTAWDEAGLPRQPGVDEEYEGPDLSTQPGQ